MGNEERVNASIHEIRFSSHLSFVLNNLQIKQILHEEMWQMYFDTY
jgi:hypothetical protein